MSAAQAQPQARPSWALGRPAACARSASRGALATHGMLTKLTSLLPGQSLSLLPLVSQRSALDSPANMLGPRCTMFHYHSKGLAALQAAARSAGMAGDLSAASVKLGHLGSCEQPISAEVEPWWQRLTHCCPCTATSAQASPQQSRPAGVAGAAPQASSPIGTSLDLLSASEHPSAMAASSAPIAANAAAGEASRATSDDSLAALGAGEQEKSLSLSGWNKSSSGRVQDRNMAQALIPQESTTAQVPHLSDMCSSHTAH